MTLYQPYLKDVIGDYIFTVLDAPESARLHPRAYNSVKRVKVYKIRKGKRDKVHLPRRITFVKVCGRQKEARRRYR